MSLMTSDKVSSINICEKAKPTAGVCVLKVSHDRYFMDRLVDHIFIFEGNGIVTDFPGNYTQYRLQEKENDRKKVIENNKIEANNILSDSTKKLGFKEKREFELLEKEIPTLEAEKQQIEQQLSNTEINYSPIAGGAFSNYCYVNDYSKNIQAAYCDVRRDGQAKCGGSESI